MEGVREKHEATCMTQVGDDGPWTGGEEEPDLHGLGKLNQQDLLTIG